MQETAIREYAEQYMEKVFYFCLKKTGNRTEAEDLAADISLCVVSALRKGASPRQFSAWVWQIARNRYSVWADGKHRRSALFVGADIGELDPAGEASVEEDCVHSEEMALLRRELAFISATYRELIVAYYLKDTPIRDIAHALSLTEGTVKMRLLRARHILKEGMNMAREFGAKSYKPEDISFTASGSQPSPSPHEIVRRKIPKNILLQASNNPSTIEELAVELGIAVPYMEEETELLVRAELLRKLGNKYITNFFIASGDCQQQIYAAQRRQSKARSERVDAIAEALLPQMREVGMVRGEMTDGEIKWMAVLAVVELACHRVKGYQSTWPKRHADGTNWGFIGYEQTTLPESCFAGQNGNGDGRTTFWAYKISDYDMWERAGEMPYQQTLLLGDLIRHKRSIAALSDSERALWESIDGRFAHAAEDGTVIPDILVLEKEPTRALHASIVAHPQFASLLQLTQEAFDQTVAVLQAHSTEVLRDQLSYVASMQLLHLRMMTIHDEVEAGRLQIPADIPHSTVAMWLELGESADDLTVMWL